ncbi:MAG: winged helix-turn-helix transcriptional regulator [Thermoplasmata archaeon]|nr:winged helix-turn-helix transcriptional regulator [Thermoplasmata archaeon]
MPEGVGRALERMVKHKEPDEREGRRDASLLMNAVRRRLFEYLCLHPCSHLSEISSALKVSTNTARWHLRKLIGGDLVSKRKSGARTLYYPSDLISLDSLDVFEFLSDRRMRELYLLLVDNPGSTQSDLAKSLKLSNQAAIRGTKKLENLGLVSKIQDGVYARYFPTDLLSRKKEAESPRMKAFQDSILKRLQSEGLKPKIIRRESSSIMIEFRLASEKGLLNVPTDPFSTALAAE